MALSLSACPSAIGPVVLPESRYAQTMRSQTTATVRKPSSEFLPPVIHFRALNLPSAAGRRAVACSMEGWTSAQRMGMQDSAILSSLH